MTCRTGKHAYASPQAAHMVIQRQAKRPEGRKRHAMAWARGKVRAYRCRYCGQWHIGHTVRKELA